METTLKPMSTSQVLDRMFSMYRNSFLLYVGIAMMPQLCLLFGRMGLLLVGQAPTSSPAAMIASGLAAVVGFAGFLVLAVVCYALASGASVYAISCQHLGYAITVKDAYKYVRPYVGRIIGIVVLVGLCFFGVLFAIAILVVIVAAGFGFAGGISGPGAAGGSPIMALIAVGGFIIGMVGFLVLAAIMWAKFSLAVPACVLERLGPVEAIKRSFALTKGSVLRLVLVIILTLAVYYAMVLVLSIPYFIGLARAVTAARGLNSLMPYIIWQYVAEFIASSLSAPLASIAYTLIYYDERVRKEAFDLQWMMEMVGKQSPTPLQDMQQPQGPAASPSSAE